jgi:hypothetical protein
MPAAVAGPLLLACHYLVKKNNPLFKFRDTMWSPDRAASSSHCITGGVRSQYAITRTELAPERAWHPQQKLERIWI